MTGPSGDSLVRHAGRVKQPALIQAEPEDLWRATNPAFPDAISCKFPAPRRCRTASCGRWTRRCSTTAARSSRSWACACFRASRPSSRPRAMSSCSRPRARARGKRLSINAFSPGDKILMFETGHFATLWKTMATKLGLNAGIHRIRLAQRRRPGRHRSAPQGRQEARDQGRLRRPQRDLDRRHLEHRRHQEGDRRRASPGAVPGRHRLGPRLGRFPHGRMGRGRHRRGLAEGPDAAARHRADGRHPKRR